MLLEAMLSAISQDYIAQVSPWANYQGVNPNIAENESEGVLHM